MLKAAFEELTVERGETINILGMTVYMDREHGKAVINQQHFLDKVCSTYGITRAAVTPATRDRRDLVQDIRDEHTSLIGVGGARVVARETGEAGVFGRSRIVPGTGVI